MVESGKAGNEGERVGESGLRGVGQRRKKEERMVESGKTGNESDKEGERVGRGEGRREGWLS